MLSNIVTHEQIFGNIAKYCPILLNITKYDRGYMDMNLTFICIFIVSDIVTHEKKS